MTVKEIKIGWKKLQKDLESLRTAINHNQPVRGDGILINETDTGCVISIAKPGDGAPVTAGQWTPVTIINPDTCAQSTLWVWALPQ